MSTRDVMLQRVRSAVVEGNRLGDVPALPERGDIGYQGGGDDAVQRFCDEMKAAGGQGHVAPDPDAACQIVLDLLRSRGVRRAVLSRCELIERLDVAKRLREAGIETHTTGETPYGSE